MAREYVFVSVVRAEIVRDVPAIVLTVPIILTGFVAFCPVICRYQPTKSSASVEFIVTESSFEPSAILEYRPI